MIGTLKSEPARARPDLLAPPVVEALRRWPGSAARSAGVEVDDVLVAGIDPNLADTAEFCVAYQVGPVTSHPAR